MSRWRGALLLSCLLLILGCNRGGDNEGTPVPKDVEQVSPREVTADDSDAKAEKQTGKKLALLIGCTKYDTKPQDWQLRGPANDVLLMHKVLTERFLFRDKNIVTLAEGSEAGRPTYANIVAAFENLLKKADDETQVVILFCGHGSQIPIPDSQLDPLDPRNPEPDGLDEIFLPADIHTNRQQKLEGYILDDQIGAWLDRFRDKGAAVWVIFDCCHSGTMDRGDPDDMERSREIRAEALGVPRKDIDAAVQRAAEAVRKAKESGRNIAEDSPLNLSSAKKGQKGSVVAFYATQSFERAPELTRPSGAPSTAKNCYGLLTYTLYKVLDQMGTKLTYRELSRALVAQYQAERGTRGPTPFSDGDLDREVLGIKEWPHRSRVVLRKEAMEINAGELAGLTRGSILALHPPAGDKGDRTKILGYVQVSELATATAKVSPCKHHDKDPVPLDKIPDLASCELVSRDFGHMKLTYAVAVPDAGHAKLLAKAIKAIDKDVLDMIKEVPMTEAEWLLVVKNGNLQLRHGEGRKLALDKAAEVAESHALAAVANVYEICPLDLPAERIAESLSRDLPRVFTWQFLWRIAGSQSAMAAAKESNLDLRFEVVKMKGGQPDGPLLSGAPVQPGQKIRIALHNRGLNDLWVTLLILDSDFKITAKTTSIKAGEELKPLNGSIDGKTTGKEGIIVLAGGLDPTMGPPDLAFLNQPPLKVGTRAVPDVSRGPQTPFGQLLATARLGKGTRTVTFDAPNNPVMLSWSWVSVNPRNKGK